MASLSDKWKQLERALSEGPREPAHRIVHQIGNDWRRSMRPLGRKFVFQGAKVWSGSRSGLQYLYHLLTEPTRSWPDLPSDQRTALSLAVQLAVDSGAMPFPQMRSLPSSDEEDAIDAAIRKIALWARMDMVIQSAKDLQGIIQKNVPAIVQVHGDQLPIGKAYAYLKRLLKYDLERHARWFTDANLLSQMLVLAGI